MKRGEAGVISARTVVIDKKDCALARLGHANRSTPMTIQIVREPITPDELRSLAHGQFGDFVKAVVGSTSIRTGWGRIVSSSTP